MSAIHVVCMYVCYRPDGQGPGSEARSLSFLSQGLEHCMYVCMYVCIYARIYVCMCVSTCVYVCMCVRLLLGTERRETVGPLALRGRRGLRLPFRRGEVGLPRPRNEQRYVRMYVCVSAFSPVSHDHASSSSKRRRSKCIHTYINTYRV